MIRYKAKLSAMATIPNGILGALNGRMGPVTGYRRNGVNVIRVSTRKKDKVITAGRLAQREKLKLCNDFTRAFTGTNFFKRTFPGYGHTGTGLHRATSALMNLAVTGTYPDLSLSYPSVLISKGLLPGAVNANALSDSQQNILFTWDDNSDVGTAGADDMVVVAAFDIQNNEAVFSLNAGIRQDQAASLNISGLRGKTIATWLSFINTNGDVADSVFCRLIEG